MKLVVQIPCLDEEETLASTIKDIPRQIPGIDKVEVLVIDDGSSDKTAQIAKAKGAEHLIRLSKTKGLGVAFAAGLETALQLGADIIVNTDGDNQYRGEDIPKLIQPILEGKAQIVLGDRRIANIKQFGFVKRLLHRIGNAVVTRISGLVISDATSGFRAISARLMFGEIIGFGGCLPAGIIQTAIDFNRTIYFQNLQRGIIHWNIRIISFQGYWRFKHTKYK